MTPISHQVSRPSASPTCAQSTAAQRLHGQIDADDDQRDLGQHHQHPAPPGLALGRGFGSGAGAVGSVGPMPAGTPGAEARRHSYPPSLSTTSASCADQSRRRGREREKRTGCDQIHRLDPRRAHAESVRARSLASRPPCSRLPDRRPLPFARSAGRCPRRRSAPTPGPRPAACRIRYA